MNVREFAYQQVVKWFLEGNVGASSKAMVTNILFQDGDRPRNLVDHPYDPADLKRCVELLDAVPPIRRELAVMENVSPTWKLLISNWDVLESTLKYEMKTNGTGKAPRTYELMKEIMSEVGNTV